MAATATGGVIGFATSASAGTPPTGPGNIEVFPSRDMVAIEGYTAQAGQTATLTVTRGGQTVGTATGEVDATGFMEWNHEATPNGDGTFAGCFTDVTPDIQPGDDVSVSFSASPLVDGMKVSSAEVTGVTASTPAEGNVNTVTITGTYGADVDLNRFAVEVVNPAMRDAPSAIGERAIGWSPNEPPEAVQGYTVEGTAANGEFSVTFGGLSPSDQQLVFDGEKVALAWMADRTGVEQQLGLTLAEYGLVGGGAPGCAPGPDGARPPAGEFSVVWNNQSQATVTWAAAAPVAGGAAVTGYSVEAVNQTADASGAQQLQGARVGANATQVVLDGLDAGSLYDIEVRSMVAGEIGAPFALAGTAEPTPPEGTALELTTTPAFNGDTAVIAEDRQLTLAANAGTIYYTLDGSAVTTQPNGNVPSPTAKIYTEPLPITAADTRVNVAVIDAAGGVAHATGVVSPRPAAAAVAPTGLAVLGINGAGPDAANPQGTVNIGWTAVPDATEYRVRVYDRDDAAGTNTLVASRDVLVTTTNAQVTGLPKSATGHRWVLRVQAKTPAATTFGPLSTGVNAVVPGDSIGVVSAQWRAGDELQIRGSGTNPGATITAHRVNAVGGPGVALGYPQATVGALEAPGNTGPWEIVVDPAPAANPGDIILRSSEGSWVKVTVETR
ncbi:fibronectin type III domain-containing protein [Geodermatophilus sp. SYSU D00703]